MALSMATISGTFLRPDLSKAGITVYIEAATVNGFLISAGSVITSAYPVKIGQDGSASVTLPQLPQAGILPSDARWRLVMVVGANRYTKEFTLAADITWNTLVDVSGVPITSALVSQAQAAAAAAAASAASISGVTAVTWTGQTSVKNPTYGAVGNDTADDTTAIHAARDAAGVGGTVVFPAGTYKTTGLTASVANQLWVLLPGATLHGTGAAHVVNVTASGVTIQGPGKIDTNAASAFSGVFIGAGLSDVDVLGVEIVNGTYGVRCKGGTGAVTTRLRVNGCTIHDTSSHGVFFNWETTDSEISQNQLYNNTGNGIWCGNGSTGQKIVGNTIKSGGRMGIELAAGTGCADSLVAYNNIDTVASIGISADNSDRARVIGNRVTAAASYGLEAAGTNYAVFEANVVLNSGSYGIGISAVSGTCDHNLVKGNQFINCANAAVTAGGTANGAKHLQIIDNHIVDPGQNAGSVNAIGCTTGIGCDAWLIQGNHIIVTSGTLASTNLINLNLPNTAVLNNQVYVYSTVTTGGGVAVNFASTAIGCTMRGNVILGNGKLGRGALLATTVTSVVIDSNVINGTTTDVINNQNTTATSIQITNNVWTLSAGNGVTYNLAQRWGNRSQAGGTNFDIGGTSGTTAPAAGGAGALPATPLGYLTVTVNGTNRQIAYY